jgi:hypothetical protein
MLAGEEPASRKLPLPAVKSTVGFLKLSTAVAGARRQAESTMLNSRRGKSSMAAARYNCLGYRTNYGEFHLFMHPKIRCRSY